MTVPTGLRNASILWLSHGYGYDNNLMYFAPIFSNFTGAFPNTTIFVEPQTVANHPGLRSWLSPLRFRRLRFRRNMRGIGYDTEIKLPSLSLVWKILARRPNAAVIIEFTPTALLGFAVVKLLLRKKLLLLIENDPVFRGGRSKGVWLKIKSWVARNADLVMTNNASGLAFVRDSLGVPASRIFVAPYLTSEVAHVAPEEGRKSPSRAISFLFLNSITERKGIMALLQAITLLDPQVRAEIELRVVGTGPLLDDAARFVSTHDLSSQVTLVGKVDYQNVGIHFVRSDVFVSTTLADYRSLAGFEALSAGKPLLMSVYDGAHQEVVQPGVNGFLIDPANPADIAAKITWIVENRDRIADMGSASVQMAKAFSFDAIAGNLEQAVIKILQQGT